VSRRRRSRPDPSTRSGGGAKAPNTGTSATVGSASATSIGSTGTRPWRGAREARGVRPVDAWTWAREWIFGPQPVQRLVLLRIVVPLAVLGFLTSRMIHADEWLSPNGFHLPDLGGDDWRQPLFLPPIPAWGAWMIVGATTIAGLSLMVGCRTRLAGSVFAALIAYLVLADRLEAFTVSKIAPVLSLALALSPCDVRFGVDAWRRRRGGSPSAQPPPDHVTGGTVRFFQVFLVVMYSGSGIAKARGDWLSGQVLWTHLHDNYQTAVGWHVMNALPAGAWRILQDLTLVFEVGAPLWFALPWTRVPALVVGLGMHAMIGLMFGPVVWFALLMSGMLVACYAPRALLVRVLGGRPLGAGH